MGISNLAHVHDSNDPSCPGCKAFKAVGTLFGRVVQPGEIGLFIHGLADVTACLAAYHAEEGVEHLLRKDILDRIRASFDHFLVEALGSEPEKPTIN